MNLSKVTVKGTPNPIVQDKIEAVEKSHGFKFPVGYSEFMQQFGEGELSEIRVYSPSSIVEGVDEWRSMVLDGWFMSSQSTEISAEKAIECYMFADTQSGDQFIFHPATPNDVYIFPRNSNESITVKGGFAGVLAWYVTSPLMVQPEEWVFFPS